MAFSLLCFGLSSRVEGQSAAPHPLGWVTLGTEGGPVPDPKRSQPANLLVVDGAPWMVDCGDGATERLAEAGFLPAEVNTVFLSHLHADHIAGLQGLIALHWFGQRPGTTPVTIYGPPGTDTLVAGIVQSLAPTEWIAQGELPGKWAPAQSVKVVILKGGADRMVQGVRVRAVQNSHFDNPPGQPQPDGTQSLAYRFDMQGYAIGYTGDTGPSDAVAALERHVNLLVSEVFMAAGYSPDMPGEQDLELRRQVRSGQKAAMGPDYRLYHFEYQHLSPEDAAKLATAAGAQQLVFTHLAVDGPTDVVGPRIVERAQPFFKGEITVAQDLDRF